jgi:hypothetical protein
MKYKDCVQYLGPSNCNNIKDMALGSISETIFYNNGFYIFKIDELSQTQVNETNFNDFKEQVLFDYNNYQDDQSFIEYIEFLKSRASISKFDLK